MTIGELERAFTGQLLARFHKGEAEAMCRMVTDKLVDKNRDKSEPADPVLEDAFNSVMKRLLNDEPLQHILGQSWFCDLLFKVNNNVLIPRPETEELVYLIHKETKKHHPRILDIGTGSGCIAIALKKLIPGATVTGIDVSDQAIEVARLNAVILKQAVNFHQMDIFGYDAHYDFMHTYEKFDIIVSNPPYIPLSRMNEMARNVRDFEPHLALFVPDDDPLIFYRQIAAFSKEFLADGGKIYFEAHYDRVDAVVELVADAGFAKVWGKKDMAGNDRFILAGM